MVTRVREMLERSRKSLLDGTARQRLEGSTRQLLERSRATVAQLVGTPHTRESTAQEVLVGVCSSVALRDLNLVDSLLEQLEKMEANEDDPDSLAQLYKLDHLATRLRRNSENLRVLAGRDAGGAGGETSSLVDVVRAGISSIEHYTRVEIGQIANLGVVGFAADDVSRLLSELLDNATTHSPPTSTVKISAHLTEQGSVMVRVEDAGIGMPAARLSALNERLSEAPVLDRNAVQHMGLAVVRRLSSRHGINVWLSRRAPHGTTASVLLPVALVQDAPVTMRRRTNGAKQTEFPSATAAQDSEGARGYAVPEGISRKGNVFVDPGTVAQPPEDQSPTTPNGLPRRVPQSLKESSVTWPPPSADTEGRTHQDQQEGHEQLLADLGDFAEGEQAAHDDHQTRNDARDSGGSDQ
jgi:signal transduction histidine kinase